jgi:pimeloyl-ACP methyl ester carboxylesterase
VPLLDRDGVAISYGVHGQPTDGVPLLLSHGYSASSAMWRGNLDALSADRLVVTWDLRGHGKSAAPTDLSEYSEAASVTDMATVLDAAGIERAAIGGLSLGGYLSLAFYLAHPERVAALLLFDTGPGYRDDAARSRWNEWAEARAVAFERDGVGALTDSPEVGKATQDPVGLALAARGILTQHNAAVIECLPSIAVPTIVLVGADDHGFLAAADYMAAKIPHSTRTVLAGAGHASNIDQPKAFNDAVSGFLAVL